MGEGNAETARKAIEALNEEGVDGIIPYLHPEVEWHTDPNWIEPGVHKGIDAVVAYLRQIADTVGGVPRFAVTHTEAVDDDTVLAQTTAYRKVQDSEAEVVLLEWSFVVTFRHGLQVRVRSFFDVDAAREAAGLTE